ncbi:hypothetical protein GQ457_05G025400 [Hibiscus cannabinus]
MAEEFLMWLVCKTLGFHHFLFLAQCFFITDSSSSSWFSLNFYFHSSSSSKLPLSLIPSPFTAPKTMYQAPQPFHSPNQSLSLNPSPTFILSTAPKSNYQRKPSSSKQPPSSTTHHHFYPPSSPIPSSFHPTEDINLHSLTETAPIELNKPILPHLPN